MKRSGIKQSALIFTDYFSRSSFVMTEHLSMSIRAESRILANAIAGAFETNYFISFYVSYFLFYIAQKRNKKI
jgi:hypothetical protein